MTARSLVALAAIALSTLVACGESAAPPLDSPVKYVRTGGLAGETQTLTVLPTGGARLILDTGTKHEVKDFTVDPDQFEHIEELADASDLEAIEVHNKTSAPDAYTYVLTYDGDTVQWQQGQGPQELTELTDVLDDVVGANNG